MGVMWLVPNVVKGQGGAFAVSLSNCFKIGFHVGVNPRIIKIHVLPCVAVGPDHMVIIPDAGCFISPNGEVMAGLLFL